MREKIVINAQNVNVNQGNTNNGFTCIGNNNINTVIVQTKKRDSRMKKESSHTGKKNTIFISYTHSDEKTADLLEKQLLERKYEVKRDVRDVKPWDDLNEFMRSIRKQDYVILLVSDEYLHRENCVYEIYQLLKDEDYVKRTFPIVIPFNDSEKKERRKRGKSTSMFETAYWIEVLTFWTEYLREMDEKLINIPREYTAELNSKYRDIGNMMQGLMQLFGEVFNKKLVGVMGRDCEKEVADELLDRIDQIIRHRNML